MIGRLFAATIAAGTVGLMVVFHSTFRHYYRKHAEFEDLKNDSIQEVVVVTEFVEGVEE